PRDLLAMAQMASLVVSNRLRNRSRRRTDANFSQPLVNVAHLRRPLQGAFRKGRVVLQKMPVVLQVAAASCRVGDDGVKLLKIKGAKVPSRHLSGQFQLAVVGMDRAAAKLSSRSDHLAAVG